MAIVNKYVGSLSDKTRGENLPELFEYKSLKREDVVLNRCRRFERFIFISTLFIVCFLLSIQSLKAQDSTLRNLVPSFHLSTEGIGLGVRHELKEKWSVLAEGHWIGYNKSHQIGLDNESVVDIDPSIKRGSFQVKIQYQLNPSWIYAEGGLGVLFSQSNRLTLSTGTGIDSEGLQITAEDFGKVKVDVLWSQIQPYLGFRFGSLNPQKKLNIQGVLGCHFLGSPNLFIDYNGFLETTNLDTDIKTIERNMRNYSFYPKLGIVLSYNSVSF